MMQSRKLLRYANLKHGFTTKDEGDVNLRKSAGILSLSRVTGIKPKDLVGFEQVHGTQIAVVNKKDSGTIISGSDGGLTEEQNIFLTINTADCVPLLFFDRAKNLIAAVHAGWRGVVGGVVEIVLDQFLSLESLCEDLIVVIGPHIGACCYTVSENRVQLFKRRFGPSESMVYQEGNEYHLDIASPIMTTLKKYGFLSNQIDYFLSCTSCQIRQFFSYRRDGTIDYGEMAAFIGIQ